MSPTQPPASPLTAPSANTPPADSLQQLQQALRAFAAARQWQPFHAPKNLAMALAVEAAEVMEHFQWLSEADSRALPGPQREAVALELADVLLYLVQLADQLGVDLLDSARTKMGLNALKYPAPPA